MIAKEPLAKELYDVLACPLCKSNVNYNSDKTTLICVKCNRRYHIRGDIPIMMV